MGPRLRSRGPRATSPGAPPRRPRRSSPRRRRAGKGGRRGGGREGPRRRCPRGASCLRGRHRSHRRRPSPCHHTPLMREPTDTAAPPEYKVYRTRPRLLQRGGDSPLDELRGTPPGAPPKRRRRITVGRVVKWLVLAVVGWLVLSLVLFLISATLQQDAVPDTAQGQLAGGGVGLTSPQTTLVLGSDRRSPGTREPGATVSGPSRSDSIMLLRFGGGHSAKLSIPRDTVVDIPGHGRDKINAAYAAGGPALTIRTVEQYLGVDVDHVFLVNFENFPSLIDAMGGIDYSGRCVVSRINGGFK